MQVIQNNGGTYLLHYEFEKQLANRNQQYHIILEHFKITRNHERTFGELSYEPSKPIKTITKRLHLGFDSYYPDFEENKPGSEIKNQYTLEVNHEGKIIRYEPFKENNYPTIILKPINSMFGQNSYSTYSDHISDSILVKYFSRILMQPNKDSKIISADQIVGIRYRSLNERDSI